MLLRMDSNIIVTVTSVTLRHYMDFAVLSYTIIPPFGFSVHKEFYLLQHKEPFHNFCGATVELPFLSYVMKALRYLQ